MPEYGFSCVTSLLTLKMCSVYVRVAEAETRSSATDDKLETGILIYVTQLIFHGCRLHVTGGPWQIWQTFLRPNDSWVGTWEQRTADRCLATCLGTSVANDTVAMHPPSAIQRPKWFGNFVIPFRVITFSFFSSLVSFRFVFVWADFYVSISVCVNEFIIFSLTNIFVSVSVNKNHTDSQWIYSSLSYIGILQK